MRVLLDSHVYVWWLQASRRLGREARRVLETPGAQVFVSAASIWELSIKRGLGKLRWRGAAPPDLVDAIVACGFIELPVTARHAAAVQDLPAVHGDPFDRLLVAQARIEELRLVTADPAFEPYGVTLLPADA